MDRIQTTGLSDSVDLLDGESNANDQEEHRGQTVAFSDFHAKETGNTAITKLEAIASLVQHEAVRDEERPVGARGERAAEGTEEALDDYMKQFMERVTGKKAEVVAPAQPAKPELPLPAEEPAVEVRQPARAPENSASLDRMRDLANANSRSALQVHEYRQYSNRTTSTFLPAAVASLGSTVMAVLCAATGSGWCLVGALGLLAAALAFGWQFWKTSRKLYRGTC